MIDSDLSVLIMHSGSMDDFDKLKERVMKYGGDKLVDLYNEWCINVDHGLLLHPE